MLKVLGRLPVSHIAYVLLLVGFVSLGLFVTAMAFGSDLALVAGIVLIASLGGAVAGFRKSARQLDEARLPDASAHNVSIFSTPLRRDEVDRYLQNYRAESGEVDVHSQPLEMPSARREHRRAA
ncbi:hypothetical protein A5742_13970 [Mycolicibacterium fortuitum]|uniref:Uncharacterized protein n=1 Tax=Mycolicibacterium fortuitum TaxID=1766 RepID=A0ABD6QCJ9_MYCFO|nr:hypothetical protein [Mycolicibacterium fortuitum]OMC34230.1 hypothetical protein A5742_13970 [Mycolicibacterium fortuitum]